MCTLHITNVLKGSEGIATRTTFSSSDQRKTYARVQDETDLLASIVKRFRTRPEFNNFFGSYVDSFVNEYFPSKKGINRQLGKFKLVKKLDFTPNNFEYAFGQIELYSKLFSACFLIGKIGRYGVQHVINTYFDSVDIPQRGDLVAYYEGDEVVHAGIFLPTKPSIGPGIVESTWGSGFPNRYVFAHDFFFLPQAFGKLVKIYRVKNELPGEQNCFQQPGASKGPMYKQVNGVFCFESSKENIAIREIIDDTLYPALLVQKLPEIQVTDIRFLGQCSMYALAEILPKYEPKLAHESQICGRQKDSEFLGRYFTLVDREPMPGDLAVYSLNGARKHFGIYRAQGLIESKWGQGRVYRHPPFHVGREYGDTITFYRLNPGVEFEPNVQLDSCLIC